MLTYLVSDQNSGLYSIDHCCSPHTVKLKRTEFSMQVSSLKSQVSSREHWEIWLNNANRNASKAAFF